MFSRSQAISKLALLALIGCGDSSSRLFCEDPTQPGCEIPVVSTTGLGRHTSAVAWNDGRLAAASWDHTRGELVVAFYTTPASAPELRIVPRTATGIGRSVSMAAESDGGVQLVWFEASQGVAAWTHGDLQGFVEPEVIGTGPGVRGTFVSLALDDNDQPHVALRDETRKALSYATRTAGQWVVEKVDTCAGEADCPAREDAGEWAQLALVPGVGGVSLPRIAFYDRLRGDLKLAALGADGRWVTSTLDGRDPVTGADTGDVGRFISLATTPGRTLGLAYFDATREALRYLGPNEEPRIVDAGLSETGPRRRVTVGQYPSLRYDPGGQAHIIYTDTTTPALRHLVVRATGTSGPTILDLPPGAWPSLSRVSILAEGGTPLVGAYGAFGDAPHQSRLVVFEYDAEATP